MKRFANIAQIFLFVSLLAPSALLAQAVAQVVYISTEGVFVERGDSLLSVEVGQILTDGDLLKSNDATVILSICDGSLVTVYPQSTVRIDTLQAGVVALKLLSGEVLGDNGGNCEITVGTKVGEAYIIDGVFGVVLSDDGENGWTLQVRNLDGSVSFTGQPNLDTSATVVTLLEPNKVVDIPPGEEFIVRGIYDAEGDVFALAKEGVAIAVLSDISFSSISRDVEFMNAQMEAWKKSGGGLTPGKTPPPPEEIEIPFEEFDVASEKG